MTLKIYVHDMCWEGAEIVVTSDPNVAYAKLIQPMIDMYRTRAEAHDRKALEFPDETPNNPWWSEYHRYVQNGLFMCKIYDAWEGTEFKTSGG
jgi:hypothetical protein